MAQSLPMIRIVVVGFNHSIGNKVDFSIPELSKQDNEVFDLDCLPFLALPDGAHLGDSGFTFFTLPYKDTTAEGGTTNHRTIWGVSCYKQISTKELSVVTSDVSRSSVMKAVVALSPRPCLGYLLSRLRPVTDMYFRQGDFENRDLLIELQRGLSRSSELSVDVTSPLNATDVLLEVPLITGVKQLGRAMLLLMKAVMLERRVVISSYSADIHLASTIILGLLSLFPNFTQTAPLICADEQQATYQPPSSGSEADTEEIRRLQLFGFPLNVFGKHNFVEPYFCLQQMKPVTSGGFVIGTSNLLFLRQTPMNADIVFDVAKGDIIVLSEDLKKALSLSTADRLFMDTILDAIPKEAIASLTTAPGATNPLISEEELQKVDRQEATATTKIVSEWTGGDDWIRKRFQLYLESLLSAASAYLHSLADTEDGDPSLEYALAGELSDWNPSWVNEWRKTENFRSWSQRRMNSKIVSDLSSLCPPKHPCAFDSPAGELSAVIQTSVKDLQPYADKVGSALSGTAKFLSVTAQSTSATVSSYFQPGPDGSASKAQEKVTAAKETAAVAWGKASTWFKAATKTLAGAVEEMVAQPEAKQKEYEENASL